MWKTFQYNNEPYIMKLEIKENGLSENILLWLSNLRILWKEELSLKDCSRRFKFFSEVTTPLINTIKYLEESQKKMSELLIKKDRELEEYKLEKGNITREDLATTPYVNNGSEDISNSSLMLNLFNQFSEPFSYNGIDKEGHTNEISNKDRAKKQKIYSSKTKKKPRL
ncbi:hypothetical protein WA026_015844 [Henosepilachna vigintioctopunctata]|uniref:Uncharacterized protein n=1 Tax=Henosepilachna vigintioctopunctata TaxID=420089 RepID=A0AAW1US79_9CUCU